MRKLYIVATAILAAGVLFFGHTAQAIENGGESTAPSATAERREKTFEEMKEHAAERRAKLAEQFKEAREKAKERREGIKEKFKERRAKLKQEICERREARLQKLLPKLTNSAGRLQSNTDRMFERVKGFYEKGQLSVSNYDELVANVETAKATSAAAVENIKEFEFDLSCEDREAGNRLAGFREAVREARTSIKAYRTTLVKLISALRSAIADKTGSEQPSDNPAKPEEEQ